MKIERIPRVDIDMRLNSFGQFVTSYDDVVDVTVTGSLAELLEYSKESSIYIRRCPEVEHLFESWDKDSRYVVISNGEVWYRADSTKDINGVNWYVHKGVLVEEDPS